MIAWSDRRRSAGIEVGVKFNILNIESSEFKKQPDAARCNPFANGTYYPSDHNDIFAHFYYLSINFFHLTSLEPLYDFYHCWFIKKFSAVFDNQTIWIVFVNVQNFNRFFWVFPRTSDYKSAS